MGWNGGARRQAKAALVYERDEEEETMTMASKTAAWDIWG